MSCLTSSSALWSLEPQVMSQDDQVELLQADVVLCEIKSTFIQDILHRT